MRLTVYEPPRDKTNKRECAPSEDTACQADMSLRWAHAHFVGFVMSWSLQYFGQLTLSDSFGY